MQLMCNSSEEGNTKGLGIFDIDIIKFSNKPNTYHLKDIEVNKNEKIAVIDGLVGGNFVFVVKALDSDNNTLTLSRGILNEG